MLNSLTSREWVMYLKWSSTGSENWVKWLKGVANLANMFVFGCHVDLGNKVQGEPTASYKWAG
jgi:hypothetical protein